MKYHFESSLGNITHQTSKSLGINLSVHLTRRGITITPEQWCVISMLYATKPSSQTQVGDFLGYDKVRVARLIEKLEHDGLITRHINPLDKRVKMVTLTAKGDKLYRMVEPWAEKTLAEATRGISPEEIILLLNLLKTINQNLEYSSWNLENK